MKKKKPSEFVILDGWMDVVTKRLSRAEAVRVRGILIMAYPDFGPYSIRMVEAPTKRKVRRARK